MQAVQALQVKVAAAYKALHGPPIAAASKVSSSPLPSMLLVPCPALPCPLCPALLCFALLCPAVPYLHSPSSYAELWLDYPKPKSGTMGAGAGLTG